MSHEELSNFIWNIDNLIREPYRPPQYERVMLPMVLPYIPDAWVDESKTKVGYEINFNRHLYKYEPPRSLEEIDADLDAVAAEVLELLQEVHS